MTILLKYLRFLEDDSWAIVLCQHFRRIAMLKTTETSTVTFPTGQPADVIEDMIDSTSHTGLDVPEHASWTTAHHEAVKASNYLLVEYLVLTDFVVEAHDSNHDTALNIAVDIERDSIARNPIKNKQIIALLQQNRATTVDPSELNLGLLLGGQFCQVNDIDDSVQAWRETSIDSNFDAITFKPPKAGLWQDQRIAFGQCRVGGKGQSFHLDPLRFLRSRRADRKKPMVASSPFSASNGT